MNPMQRLTPRHKTRSSAAGLMDDRNQMFGSKCLAGCQLHGHGDQAAGLGPWEKENLGKCRFV